MGRLLCHFMRDCFSEQWKIIHTFLFHSDMWLKSETSSRTSSKHQASPWNLSNLLHLTQTVLEVPEQNKRFPAPQALNCALSICHKPVTQVAQSNSIPSNQSKSIFMKPLLFANVSRTCSLFVVKTDYCSRLKSLKENESILIYQRSV